MSFEIVPILKTIAATFILYSQRQASEVLRFLDTVKRNVHTEIQRKIFRVKRYETNSVNNEILLYTVECLFDAGLSSLLNMGTCHCAHSEHTASPNTHPSATHHLIHLVLLK